MATWQLNSLFRGLSELLTKQACRDELVVYSLFFFSNNLYFALLICTQPRVLVYSCSGTQVNSHCFFFVQDLLIMCSVLFGLLYRLLCTGTRGQNRFIAKGSRVDSHVLSTLKTKRIIAVILSEKKSNVLKGLR